MNANKIAKLINFELLNLMHLNVLIIMIVKNDTLQDVFNDNMTN